MEDARPDVEMPPRRRRVRLLALCGIAFALRLAWALYAAPEAVGDFRGYLDAALAVADDPAAYLRRPTAFRLPVYPLVLGMFAGMGTDLVWLRLVNVALSTALVPLVAAMARRLGVGDIAALVAAGVIALSPTLVLFAPHMAAEHVMLLAVVGAVTAAAARSRAAARWRLVTVGGLCGLAMLTRLEALFAVPAVLVVYAFALRRRTGLSAAQRGVRVAGAALVAAILVVAWVQRNEAVVGPGAGLTTSAGVTLYRAHNPFGYGATAPADELDGLEELARHRRGVELAAEHIASFPASLVLSAARGTRDLYSVPTVGTAYAHPTSTAGRVPVGILGLMASAGAVAWRLLAVAAAASLIVRQRWTRRAAWLCGLLVAGNWLGQTVVFYGASRFRLVAIPAFAVAAGVAAGGVLQRRARDERVTETPVDTAAVAADDEALVRVYHDAEPEPEPDLDGLDIEPETQIEAEPEPEPEPAAEDVEDVDVSPDGEWDEVWWPQAEEPAAAEVDDDDDVYAEIASWYADAVLNVDEEAQDVEEPLIADDEPLVPAEEPLVIPIQRRAPRHRPPDDDAEVITPRHRHTSPQDG